MRINLKQKLNLRVIGGLIVAALFIVIYQNCAESLNLNQQDAASFNDTIPLAVETKIDQIAYMSCNSLQGGFNKRAHFTLRAGAYSENSGMHLSDDFYALTSNMEPEKRAETISTSTINMDSRLQMAIRVNRNQLQNTYENTEGVQEGNSYANILAPIGNEYIARGLSRLPSNTKFINYFNGVPGLDGRLIEGSLYFTKLNENSFQEMFTNGGLLSFTYTFSADSGETRAQFPAGSNPQQKALGYGYALEFVQNLHGIPVPVSDNDAGYVNAVNPSGGAAFLGTIVKNNNYDFSRLNVNGFNNQTNNRIASVSGEVNLLGTNSGIRNWRCDRSMQFLIVRFEDIKSPFKNASGVNYELCPPELDGNAALWGSNATDPQRIIQQKVRNILRAEDWDINWSLRCIRPKKYQGSCYEQSTNTSSTDQIIYGKKTGLAKPSCGPNVIVDGKVQACPHYATICIAE